MMSWSLNWVELFVWQLRKNSERKLIEKWRVKGTS